MARSNCPGGGLYVVESEVSLLLTAMRRDVRWSSHSHQDEDQDVLLKGLAALKEDLNDVKHLSQIEPGAFMAPFLEIIRSEETTGPVTSLALSAVNKIISYGLIDPEHPAIVPCVEAIADAVTHARFVGTDASGDGVVLMRILHVLRALVLSALGDNLSNESICEIMLSCFRICFETRLSELLRRTAEHCLRDMVQHLFVRLPQFADDTRDLLSMKKMRTGSIDNTKSQTKKNKAYNLKSKSKPSTNETDDMEAQLLSPIERVKINHLATTPITPAGNIVDMQGSLNHVTPEKAGDDKSDSTAKSDSSKDDSNKECSNVETKCDSENKVSEGDNELPSPNVESKPIEVQVDGKPVSDPSSKSPVPDNLDNKIIDEEYNQYAQSPMSSVEDLSIDDGSSINSAHVATTKVEGESIDEYVNSQGITFTAVQEHTPYGSLCLRELFRFLVSLCSPLDKQNSEIMMHLGLSLLQVTLEVAADALSNFPSLLALIKDDLARNLILLLGTDRLSILATDLQVAFLLFEAQREHLKFQMEQFIVKLMDMVNSDSNKITYEQRELALETIVRLWKIPGLPTELFINYDCGLYSINLYEELMKMLSKVLYNNAAAMAGNWFSMQFISLDAIFTLITGIEARIPNHKDYANSLKSSRHSASLNLPKKEHLLETKTRKRLLAIGSEKFNKSAKEGIAKLTEYGLLGGTPGHADPNEIAKLLRENPTLDKKIMGEYLSKKENTSILHSFVHSFNFQNTRMDKALRQYLEAFRLPGEAPLIFLLLEKFAEHWHDSNNRPFASADAAFTLAYAVIMLNVDQHNHNVKRQNIPMTAEDFKKNLKKVNGGEDFNQEMLDEIYNAIKNEEIVMPAEQTGLVKENYLWKCLLRRGVSPESEYARVGNSGEFINKELAERAWAPIISALCRAYDKAPERALQRKVAEKFESCAAISAHYSMTSDLDTLIVSLCKFTGLAAGGQPDQVVLKLGGSGTCQLATQTLFKICHMHGDALRASWKNIVDCLQMLFRAKLLPTNLIEVEDFVDPSGKVTLIREPATPKQPPAEQGLLSSLYSYIASDTSRTPHPAEVAAKKKARKCVDRIYLKQIIEESKFLQVDSLRSLVTSLVSADSTDEDMSVFLLEQLIDVTIQNRDRVSSIWPVIKTHLDGLLTTAARENQPYLLERVTVGMLRLAIRLLRSEEFACAVLPPLSPLTHLPSAGATPLCRQIAYGLHDLVKIGAANIHSTEDWKVVFNLLECSGAGAIQPKPVPSNAVLDEASNRRSPILDPRPGSPIPEWVLVSPTGTEAPLPVAADTIVLDRELLPHDPAALAKCCESLQFLVKDVAHVTPFNFELCVLCVRTFAEALLCPVGKRARIHMNANVDEPATYQQAPIQLLHLMYTLYANAEEMFSKWGKENNSEEVNSESNYVFATGSLWPKAWQPLLQSVARLCCDSRRAVRANAILALQSILLHPKLKLPSAIECSLCLKQVLFPLLTQLLSPIAINDPLAVEETRVRAATLMSKVFLQHVNLLAQLPDFLPLWLTVLDILRGYMHADNIENLYEATLESLKNMLLVMSSAGVLHRDSSLWTPTWRAIDTFMPNLKSELFPEPPPLPKPTTSPQPSSPPQSQSPVNHPHLVPPLPQHIQSAVVNLLHQPEISYPKPIPPHPEDSCSSPTSQSPPSDTSLLSTSPVEVPVKVNVPLVLDNKEPQQIITLVSQPLPSVASPVAVQPPTALIYMPQQPQQSVYPIEVNAPEQRQNTAYQTDFRQQTVSIKETSSPTKHQYTHLPQMQDFRSGLYADTVKLAADCANQVEIPTTDATAIFNSAAYFSEDSAADRLFVVTNP